ncbi:unnamed protein product [Caretta caretta]
MRQLLEKCDKSGSRGQSILQGPGKANRVPIQETIKSVEKGQPPQDIHFFSHFPSRSKHTIHLCFFPVQSSSFKAQSEEAMSMNG